MIFFKSDWSLLLFFCEHIPHSVPAQRDLGVCGTATFWGVALEEMANEAAWLVYIMLSKIADYTF